MPDLPRVRVGRFEIIEKLGSGGTGIVYRALDTSLERSVALEVLHAHDRDRAWLEREGRAMARLVHPHVLRVYELGYHDGCCAATRVVASWDPCA